MRKLKSLVLLVCCFCLLTGFSPLYDSDDISQSNQQKMFENDLRLIENQLREQGMLSHLPVYKLMLENMYQFSTKPAVKSYSTNEVASSVYMPNGGSIYYSNYLRTGVEVSQVYLNRTDTNKYIDGTITQNVIKDLIGKIPFISTISSYMKIYNSMVFKEVRNGTGRLYIMKSSSLDGSATVIYHWHNAPYAQYYSGARINTR